MHGKNRIGYQLVDTPGAAMQAHSPLTGEFLPGAFQSFPLEQVDHVLRRATEVFAAYRHVSGLQKAEFLEAIAEGILSLGDELIQRTVLETALPEARIIGERGRTVAQIRMFASLLREGSWVDASIDTALPDRSPLPKPDIRKMLVPVGPVVVFTASNFPLAFSTAGGDTISALAAGNPVIVKAHESHLGTNELVADAIAKAAEQTGMPDGVFSSLAGKGHSLGAILVKHPLIKSVAFTGSFVGGMALHKLAMERAEPVPVFAEMSSINPVYLLPERLRLETQALATMLAGSITLGVGQFCTNPGLIIGIRGKAFSRFAELLAEAVNQVKPMKMLNKQIADGYQTNLLKSLDQSGVRLLTGQDFQQEGAPAVASLTARSFIQNPNLTHEIFGPFSLLVQCENAKEMLEVAEVLPGQLTNTLMAEDSELPAFEPLLHQIIQNCGRMIFNGLPTGVEVCPSMQHGGPFPAATDSRFTSVGTDAIRRFVRPISYQDAPQSCLPQELRDGNPLRIWRKINGQFSNN